MIFAPILYPSYADYKKSKKLDKGTKNDTGKPEFDRLSFQALGIMNAVHKFGDEKYEKGNWRKGLHFTRMCNAAIRHISAIMNGQLFDEESKMMHSAHAAVCMTMLTHYLANHDIYKNFDDLDYDRHEPKV